LRGGEGGAIAASVEPVRDFTFQLRNVRLPWRESRADCDCFCLTSAAAFSLAARSGYPHGETTVSKSSRLTAAFASALLIASSAAFAKGGAGSADPEGVLTVGDKQWTLSDNASDINWNDAKAYCEALKLDGGGWQLPSYDDLQSIYDDKDGHPSTPCFKPSDGPTMSCKVSSKFKLSSRYFWSQDFDQLPDRVMGRGISLTIGGGVSQNVKDGKLMRALCMRPRAGSGVSAPPPAGVLAFSTLQWTQSDNGQDIDWNDAKAYCGALKLAGGGWRLPSDEELASMRSDKWDIDVPCASPKHPNANCMVFMDFKLSAQEFWSGAAKSAGSAGYANFQNGSAYEYKVSRSDELRALCVREQP
jgi:hypothetical protein